MNARTPVLLALVLLVGVAHPDTAQAKRKKKRFERPVMSGGMWGEVAGPLRGLARTQRRGALKCKVKVEDYAVIAVARVHVPGEPRAELLPTGGKRDRLVTATGGTWQFTGGQWRSHVLVIADFKGPGRVRVIPGMNREGSERTLIEIDDRDVPGRSNYEIEIVKLNLHDVQSLIPTPKDAAEEWEDAKHLAFIGDLAGSARKWIWVATHTRSERARRWAIERYCTLRPYPGPRTSKKEQATLDAYQKAGDMTDLVGHNMIFSWPDEYVARTPICWRFLAEVDIAMEWLRVWTNLDQVKHRKKRMISRFRNDESGTAIYVDFRLHIPRRHLGGPPDHEPYSHEASHGYIGFGSICPTGTYNEGLTEVGRTSYWHFLGIDSAWKPFREACLASIVNHKLADGHLGNVKGYGMAAGVYFRLMELCCVLKTGEPSWRAMTRLFDRARATKFDKSMAREKRFQLMRDVWEAEYGDKARKMLEYLGLPESK